MIDIQIEELVGRPPNPACVSQIRHRGYLPLILRIADSEKAICFYSSGKGDVSGQFHLTSGTHQQMTLHAMLASLSWKNEPTYMVHSDGLDAAKLRIASNDKTKLHLKLRLSALQSTGYERIIHFFIIFLYDKSNIVVGQTCSPLIKLVRSHVPKDRVEEKMPDKLVEAIIGAISTASFDVKRACFLQALKSGSASARPEKILKTPSAHEVHSPSAIATMNTAFMGSGVDSSRSTYTSYQSSLAGSSSSPGCSPLSGTGLDDDALLRGNVLVTSPGLLEDWNFGILQELLPNQPNDQFDQFSVPPSILSMENPVLDAAPPDLLTSPDFNMLPNYRLAPDDELRLLMMSFGTDIFETTTSTKSQPINLTENQWWFVPYLQSKSPIHFTPITSHVVITMARDMSPMLKLKEKDNAALQDIYWRGGTKLLAGMVPAVSDNVNYCLDAHYICRSDAHGVHNFLPDRIFVLFTDNHAAEVYHRMHTSLYAGRFGNSSLVVERTHNRTLFQTLRDMQHFPNAILVEPVALSPGLKPSSMAIRGQFNKPNQPLEVESRMFLQLQQHLNKIKIDSEPEITDDNEDNEELEDKMVVRIMIVDSQLCSNRLACREPSHHCCAMLRVITLAGSMERIRIETISCYDSRSPNTCHMETIVASFAHAIQSATKISNRGGKVVILVPWTISIHSFVLQHLIGSAVAAGVLIVASAGNEGIDMDSSHEVTVGSTNVKCPNKRYPCCYPGVIGVGSLDEKGNPASWTNYTKSNSNFILVSSPVPSPSTSLSAAIVVAVVSRIWAKTNSTCEAIKKQIINVSRNKRWSTESMIESIRQYSTSATQMFPSALGDLKSEPSSDEEIKIESGSDQESKSGSQASDQENKAETMIYVEPNISSPIDYSSSSSMQGHLMGEERDESVIRDGRHLLFREMPELTTIMNFAGLNYHNSSTGWILYRYVLCCYLTIQLVISFTYHVHKAYSGMMRGWEESVAMWDSCASFLLPMLVWWVGDRIIRSDHFGNMLGQLAPYYLKLKWIPKSIYAYLAVATVYAYLYRIYWIVQGGSTDIMNQMNHQDTMQWYLIGDWLLPLFGRAIPSTIVFTVSQLMWMVYKSHDLNKHALLIESQSRRLLISTTRNMFLLMQVAIIPLLFAYLTSQVVIVAGSMRVFVLNSVVQAGWWFLLYFVPLIQSILATVGVAKLYFEIYRLSKKSLVNV